MESLGDFEGSKWTAGRIDRSCLGQNNWERSVRSVLAASQRRRRGRPQGGSYTDLKIIAVRNFDVPTFKPAFWALRDEDSKGRLRQWLSASHDHYTTLVTTRNALTTPLPGTRIDGVHRRSGWARKL